MRLIRVNRNNTIRVGSCKYCGSFYGGHKDGCPATTCLFCGARVCMSHGLGCGQCPVCYHGLLPGWSGTNCTCTYKGCKEKAVSRGRCRKPICRAHAIHQKLNPMPDLSGWESIEDREMVSPIDLELRHKD
jgi:hypothetical protein